jgi:hydrogenase-4 component E
MTFTLPELATLAAAVTAIFMAGSTHLRVSLWYYCLQTLLVAALTAEAAATNADPGLYLVALAIGIFKGVGVPVFLGWVMARIQVRSDGGGIVPAPLAMHGSIALLGLACLLAQGLPAPGAALGWVGPAGAISLLLTGLVLMLTRSTALSQITGFLVIENGIYLFALAETHGMPLIVEMAILLDVLVAVMIAGLLVFRIKRSFEHIDVAQLAELKD